MIRFKGLLTPEAQSLVEDASEIVNIFASRLCEYLDVSDFSDFPSAPTFARVMLIRAMSVGAQPTVTHWTSLPKPPGGRGGRCEPSRRALSLLRVPAPRSDDRAQSKTEGGASL